MAAALAAALALPVVAGAGPSSASPTFALSRLAGPNRYATAGLVAATAFPSGASTAIIATGFNYPDALAASFAAGASKTPILLTDIHDPVPPETLTALTNLRVKNVVIVGGTDAVGSDVQTTLSGTPSASSTGGNLSVIRVAGPTRYDTMEQIDLSGAAVGTIVGKNTAFIATGANFPDALGAAPVSYADHFPIVLTATDALSPQAMTTLTSLHIQQVLILGGTGAVSSGVESTINGMGITTLVRFSGTDRSDTAKRLADYAVTNFAFTNSSVNVASGDQAFGGADALASGPLGGNTVTPTLVTNTTTDAGQAVGFASEHAATLTGGRAIGGTNPLPDAEVLAIDTAGGNPNATTTGGTTVGTITLASTTTAPGGTLTGTITSPSTVASIVASGCGIANQNVTFSSTGALAVTIPAAQPVGMCPLTFTVTFNNGSSPATDPFSITVVGTPAPTPGPGPGSTVGLAAPTLTGVSVGRGTGTGANDSAVFTFNQALSSQVLSPDDFRLYRASGAFAFGTGVIGRSGATVTVSFPPGSVVNATLGAVRAGVVTNTAGNPNFPSSVAITAPVTPPSVTTTEADLAAVGSPQPVTADPAGQPLPGAATAPDSYALQFSFDKPILTQPAPSSTDYVITVSGTTYVASFCVPTPSLLAGPGQFESIQANGSPGFETAGHGFPSAYVASPQVTTYTTGPPATLPAAAGCAATTSVTAVFAGNPAALTLSTAAVGSGRVEAIASDPVGNPVGSAMISGGTAPTWPVFQQALEQPGTSPGTTDVEVIFNQQLPLPRMAGDFQLIEGNGRMIAATAVPTRTPGNSSALTVVFPSGTTANQTQTGVAGAVGFAIADLGVSVAGNNATFGTTAVALTGAGTPVDQVDLPQLVGVSTGTSGQTGICLLGLLFCSSATTSVVFTFDRNYFGSAAGANFALYNAQGAFEGSPTGNGTVVNNTVTFTTFSAATITNAAGGAGAVQDANIGDNPPPSPEQSAV